MENINHPSWQYLIHTSSGFYKLPQIDISPHKMSLFVASNKNKRKYNLFSKRSMSQVDAMVLLLATMHIINLVNQDLLQAHFHIPTTHQLTYKNEIQSILMHPFTSILKFPNIMWQQTYSPMNLRNTYRQTHSSIQEPLQETSLHVRYLLRTLKLD